MGKWIRAKNTAREAQESALSWTQLGLCFSHWILCRVWVRCIQPFLELLRYTGSWWYIHEELHDFSLSLSRNSILHPVRLHGKLLGSLKDPVLFVCWDQPVTAGAPAIAEFALGCFLHHPRCLENLSRKMCKGLLWKPMNQHLGASWWKGPKSSVGLTEGLFLYFLHSGGK